MSHRVSAHRKLRVMDSSHPIFSRPYEGRDGSCFTFVNVSFRVFCMWPLSCILFTVSLDEAVCKESSTQIIQTSSRCRADSICGNISASLRLSLDISHIESVCYPVPDTARQRRGGGEWAVMSTYYARERERTRMKERGFDV